MPETSSTSDFPAPCWGGLFAAVCTVLHWWPGAAEFLRFNREAFAAGALWQPLTAQWVHLNTPHWLVNVAAATFICWLLRPWISTARQLTCLLGGWLGAALILVLDSQCTYYAGASGALHGVLAGSAVFALAQRGPMRFAGLTLALGLVLKLLLQTGGESNVPSWLEIPVYYPAHVAGSIGGAVLAMISQLLARQRAASP